MKTNNKLFIIILLIFTLFFTHMVTYANNENVINKIEEIENKVNRIEQNQLNYKIEKDLLKEAYSSNLSTINIVLTIILGLFTIIGYLGFRDIGSLKKEYSKELHELKSLKNDFEEKIKSLLKEHEKVKSSYDKMFQKYEEQNKRITVLELQEKISKLIEKGNYYKAEEYLDIALELDKNNINLFYLKGNIDTMNHNFREAINTCEKILKMNPNDKNVIANLLELNLLVNNYKRFNKLYNEYNHMMISWAGMAFTKYLKILESFQIGDYKKNKNLIKEFINESPNKKKGFEGWSFYEIIYVINQHEDREEKRLMRDFLYMLQNRIKPDKILNEYYS